MFTILMQQCYFLRLQSENTLKGITSCKPQIGILEWDKARCSAVQGNSQS